MRAAVCGILLALGGARADPAVNCIVPSAPVDGGSLLGIVREVDVNVTVYLGDKPVAYGNASFEVSTRVMRPDLSSISLYPTSNSISGVKSATLRVEASFLPKASVTADSESSLAATTYCNCFGGCHTQPVFEEQKYSAFYSTAFWSPSVDASGNTGVVTGGCPEAGTSADTFSAEVVAAACYQPAAHQERCTALTRCTNLQFQSNANARSKHIDVECETISPKCDESSQYEVVAPTASTDRLCAGNVKNCFIDAGEVALPGTGPVPTCVDVKPCTADAYTGVGATAVTQPVCIPYTECTDSEYEVKELTRQSNRVCAALSSECSRSGKASRRTTLDDGDVPLLSESFETAAPTLTTDRVCTSTTVCNAGETLVAQASATSDRTCGAVSDPPPTGAPAPPAPPPTGMPTLIWGIVATVLAGGWIAVTTSKSSLPNWWD